jgi:hypothetical protein
MLVHLFECELFLPIELSTETGADNVLLGADVEFKRCAPLLVLGGASVEG